VPWPPAAESPSRAEGTLDWVVSAITGQSPAIEQAAISGELSHGSVIQPSEQISTGDDERVVLTHGQDVLELQPNTTVAIGGAGPNGMATVVKLIDGTVHVKVCKRLSTPSRSRPLLVATVRSRNSMSPRTTIRRGVISEAPSRAVAGGNRAVDVTPGAPPCIRSDDDATPDLGDARGRTPGRQPPAVGGTRPANVRRWRQDGNSGNNNSSGNSSSSGNGNGNGNSNGNGGVTVMAGATVMAGQRRRQWQ
jgi:uncharacterized membrane protein YgcG